MARARSRRTGDRASGAGPGDVPKGLVVLFQPGLTAAAFVLNQQTPEQRATELILTVVASVPKPGALNPDSSVGDHGTEKNAHRVHRCASRVTVREVSLEDRRSKAKLYYLEQNGA